MIITKERLKKLRKALRLTQQEFAERIGSVQNTITGYETGRRVPSGQVIALICKEFGVNETWLRTGEGDMFVSNTTAKLDEMAATYGLDRDQRILIERFIKLKPEERKAVLKYITDVVASINEDLDVSDQDEPSVEDLHAELDRHIAMEKEAEEKSGVS